MCLLFRMLGVFHINDTRVGAVHGMHGMWGVWHVALDLLFLSAARGTYWPITICYTSLPFP